MTQFSGEVRKCCNYFLLLVQYEMVGVDSKAILSYCSFCSYLFYDYMPSYEMHSHIFSLQLPMESVNQGIQLKTFHFLINVLTGSIEKPIFMILHLCLSETFFSYPLIMFFTFRRSNLFLA